MNAPVSIHDRIWGSLLGSAVGDAVGAPCEALHYRQIREILPGYDGFASVSEDAWQAAEAARAWPVGRGEVSDDTVLADLLIDCILEHDGRITAHHFARAWEGLETPVDGAGDEPVVRLDRLHPIERITYHRAMFRSIPKRELGHGETNATNAIMFIGPVGLLCAGDPDTAELMAVDITAVNQHGAPRDVAGGYAAALAACFRPGIGVEEVVEIGVEHVRDWRHTKELRAMIELARRCSTCEEFIERYHDEIIGVLIPFQDVDSEDTPYSITWNSAEVLGPTLAMFLITRGADPRAAMLGAATIGRDADTICRCAGGLIGAYGGASAIPADWAGEVLRVNRWLRLEEKARALTAIVERRLAAQVETASAIVAAATP